jgi:tRNA/tmRNA/rRNA uracil-C5-methylase (TrmA/RlmC/RlmD family)
VGFTDSLHALARQRGLSCESAAHPEPLAALNYDQELALKNEALRSFCKTERLIEPSALRPAPLPRAYRSTTKRRAVIARERLNLVFAEKSHAPTGAYRSLLDRTEHLAVYDFLSRSLNQRASIAFASALNHVIVRGEGQNLAVIFNTSLFDGAVIRRAKQLGDALQKTALGVRAAFVYLDPTGSDYYLEARRPAGCMSFKRLFGPDWLSLKIAGLSLRYPPTAFSQINSAMAPTLIDTARELLAPDDASTLVDLYCGYGLFAFTLGQKMRAIWGADSGADAIAAARDTARHLKMESRARFYAGAITEDFLDARLPARVLQGGLALLDPPRQGTDRGVIEAIAAHRPARVLHIFCGTDEIPRELARWRAARFQPARIVPLDLFPGTLHVETLILLKSDP